MASIMPKIFQVFWISKVNYIDNDNDKPIKSLLKGKGLLPPVGLARLDSQGELLPMSCTILPNQNSYIRRNNSYF
jgi:hypothetical protein